jgi:hypothetical protein
MAKGRRPRGAGIEDSLIETELVYQLRLTE